MNPPASLLAPLLPFLLLTAAAEPSLRYKFQEGTTNGYRITIESPSENNPRRFEGIILVGVRSVEENIATVFFRGRLQPRQDPNAPQHFNGPIFHPHHFGQPDPWQHMFRMSTLSPFNEAQIDPLGRILRTAALPDFPKPLEDLAALLFPTLPADPESAAPTASESTVVVDEEATGRGPHMHGGFHPGMHGQTPGRLTGLRKETSRALSPADGLARVSHEVEFRSLAKTDDQPRLATRSKTEALLDPSTGLLHSLKFEGNSTVSTLDILRKSSLVVKVEKVVGEELTRAISDAAERMPNLTEPDVEALLTQLQQDDPPKRAEAAQRLISANLDKHAKKMLPILIPFLNDNDHMMKILAGRVLGLAATEEHLPLIYRLLKQEDQGQHHEAIQALGRIGHKDSLPILADMIAYGSNNAYAAAQALGQFGSAAEEAALALLKEKHLETRRQAIQILQKAGSSKSIEPLQAIVAAGDPQLIHDATEAVRAIRQRGDEAAKLLF